MRADRYATETLARRFRAGRTALRMLLAQRCRVDPAAVAFGTHRFGKPALVHPTPETVHFNVSHSGAHMLVAVTDVPVGVDLESIRTNLSVDELAPLTCHAEEWAHLSTLEGGERLSAFFRLWTRKEAYVKTLGVGLQLELGTIRFRPCPRTSALRALDGKGRLDMARTLCDIEVMPGFMGCVCAESADAFSVRSAFVAASRIEWR